MIQPRPMAWKGTYVFITSDKAPRGDAGCFQSADECGETGETYGRNIDDTISIKYVVHECQEYGCDRKRIEEHQDRDCGFDDCQQTESTNQERYNGKSPQISRVTDAVVNFIEKGST